MGHKKVRISTCTCSRPAPRKGQYSTTCGVAWHTIAAPNATGIWTWPGRARVCPTYDRCLLFAPFSTNVSANSLLFVRAACYGCLCSVGSQHADHHVCVAPAGARDVATLRVAGVSCGPGFHSMSQRIRLFSRAASDHVRLGGPNMSAAGSCMASDGLRTARRWLLDDLCCCPPGGPCAPARVNIGSC